MTSRPPTARNPAPSADRLRILHVSVSVSLSGTSKMVTGLIQMLRREPDLEIRLCVLRRGKEFEAAVQGMPLPVVLDCPPGLGHPGAVLAAVRRLRRLIEEFRPDLVHSHHWQGHFVAAAGCWRKGVCHVAHMHDTRPWLSSRAWRDRIRRRVYRRLLMVTETDLIAVSNAVKSYVCAHLDWPEEKIRVIHNGIEPPPVPAGRTGARAGVAEQQTQPLAIGAAGRFRPEKGFEHLVRAVAELKARGLAAQLYLAGTGPMEPVYRSLAAELGLSGDVHLVGHRKDMPAFYAGTDVFVSSSVAAEGLSLVLLEAMAAGCPVVATRVAGAEEVIEDGVDGLLVPPGSAAALAGAVQRLAQDRSLREALGRRAAEKVRSRFTLRRAAEEVAAFYRERAEMCRNRAGA